MKRLPLMLLLGVLALFLAGLYHLLHLRFATGDVYPPYSSFRSDPLGSKALFQSLERHRPVQRHVRPLVKLAGEPEGTMFFLGTTDDHLHMPASEWQSLQRWIERGGRLITAFRPTPGTYFSTFSTGASSRDPEKEDWIHAEEEWGVAFNFRPPQKIEGMVVPEAAGRIVPHDLLPLTLPLHTSLYFELQSEAWRVLYQRHFNQTNLPVVIERPLGRGSIVFIADAYPFSNEALLLDREAGLIAWSAGDSPSFLFEESHLGVQSNPGVASLARKYRLHAFFAALLILAGLFVWQQSVPFLPRQTVDDSEPSTVAGRDSATGFVNLLSRGIGTADLMPLCLEKWIEQVSGTRRIHPARLQEMQRLIEAENKLPPRERNPVRLYNQFAEILDQRRIPHTSQSSS